MAARGRKAVPVIIAVSSSIGIERLIETSSGQLLPAKTDDRRTLHTDTMTTGSSSGSAQCLSDSVSVVADNVDWDENKN